MKDGRKNKNIPFWVIIAVFLLISGGGVWFLLFLPFAIGGIVYYFAKKEMNKRDDERSSTMFEIKKREERDASRERAKELYSESEFEHLSTMKSVSHNEYEHYKNELDDLLAAGIIEKSEYRERLSSLRAGR